MIKTFILLAMIINNNIVLDNNISHGGAYSVKSTTANGTTTILEDKIIINFEYISRNGLDQDAVYYFFYVLLHEIGHKVDYMFINSHDEFCKKVKGLPSVTKYAEKNCFEDFAETFSSFFLPTEKGKEKRTVLLRYLSKKTLESITNVCYN